MRDLRIGAALALAFASLFAVSIVFAQQPVSPPNPAQIGEEPPAAPGQAPHFYAPTDQLAPAKESQINAEKDKRWWLDRGTALSDEQKQKIH